MAGEAHSVVCALGAHSALHAARYASGLHDGQSYSDERMGRERELVKAAGKRVGLIIY